MTQNEDVQNDRGRASYLQILLLLLLVPVRFSTGMVLLFPVAMLVVGVSIHHLGSWPGHLGEPEQILAFVSYLFILGYSSALTSQLLRDGELNNKKPDKDLGLVLYFLAPLFALATAFAGTIVWFCLGILPLAALNYALDSYVIPLYPWSFVLAPFANALRLRLFVSRSESAEILRFLNARKPAT